MRIIYFTVFLILFQFLSSSNFGQVTLPWTEGFENVGPVTTFYNDSYPINGLPQWSYDEVNFRGRLRFEMGSGFYHSGTKAATFDKTSTGYYLENANFLILELDLSKYFLSTDLELAFYYMHHNDIYIDDYDKVWIRGSNIDNWIIIYDLAENQGSAGTWNEVTGLDIDFILSQANPPQRVSSSFQVRFGQHGFNSTVSTDLYQGRTFDDISIAGTLCGHPPLFNAYEVSSDEIELSWTKNLDNEDVLIAVNSTNTFGNPVNGISYTPGNTLPGGGTIVSIGSSLSFLHADLSPNTAYFYKAWSFSPQYDYSCGIEDNAQTPCESIVSFPYIQDFENAGIIPDCWRQENLSGDNVNWAFTKGNKGKAHPENAYSGIYNACLQDTDDNDDMTRLISPPFDLTIFSSATLSFWHTQEFWLLNQDELKIYYKTSAGGSWVILDTFSNSVGSWTNTIINLPNLSSTYYISFSGNAKYGYGICIDDVIINGTPVLFPIANFSSNTTTPFLDETVTFTDLSTNNPTSWSWSFVPATVTFIGGTSANSQNPQVQFNETVNYTVELTASNANGSDQESKPDYIAVIPKPESEFSADTLTPAIGEIVTFTDLSDNNPTAWLWSFVPATVTYAGGTDANSQNPQVQFLQSGNYTVELSASNPSGSDLETKTDYISVLPVPEVDFTANTQTPAIGEIVSFMDITTNNPTTWSWSFIPSTVIFAGGTDANSQNPQVQFIESGNYTVELSASNASGSDLETKADYISVLPVPHADFTADILTPAIGEIVSFTDLSTNNPTLWAWSFLPATITFAGGTDANSQNPQVQFNESGNYTVELSASNASGIDIELKVDYIVVHSPFIVVDLKVFLEGSFYETEMVPTLNAILPLSQPFNTQPWNYAGYETVGSIPNPNIVDWVLIEIRDASNAVSATSQTMVDRQAAFLLSDGSIVGLDGVSKLEFTNSVLQHLFVVVYHRNHLGIMSSAYLSETAGIYSYNFTNSETKAYGFSNTGQKEVLPGIWGMFGGDGDHNGTINSLDKLNALDIQAGTEGYLESDYNLDSQSNNKDKNDIWLPNEGKESQVPN